MRICQKIHKISQRDLIARIINAFLTQELNNVFVNSNELLNCYNEKYAGNLQCILHIFLLDMSR